MSTTSKFSGPWHVITDSQGYESIHHATADDGGTGDIVATCFQDAEHARLIAAAPELYEALEATRDALAKLLTDSGYILAHSAALAQADAALAKSGAAQ